jgi:hypothetical protein
MLSLVLVFGSGLLSLSVVNVALAVDMPDAPVTQDTITAGNDGNDDNEDDEDDEGNEQNDDDQEDAPATAGGDSDNDEDNDDNNDDNSEPTSKDAPVTTDTISDKKPKCPKGQEVTLFSISCQVIGGSASPTPIPSPTPTPALSDEDCEINQEKVMELNVLCNIPILGLQKDSQCGDTQQEETDPEVTGTNPILDPQSNHCVNAPVVDHPSTSDSQTPSQANDCENGPDPLPIGCQNTASQIQGDENSAALSSEQAFE